MFLGWSELKESNSLLRLIPSPVTICKSDGACGISWLFVSLYCGS